ncbi:MAG: hypothetical protein HY013_00890 [Candidatus Solibacter usitatus]|nr:hypothetical protein [Candidatus Solibacter usitatus]
MPLKIGILAAHLAFAAQFLAITSSFGGDWTAFFSTGSVLPVPRSLAEALYVFPDTLGYDGQYYHYMAHDPLIRGGLREFIDTPRLRYRRILVSGLAWLVSGGAPRGIHIALVLVNLAFTALGAYWLSRYALVKGWPPAWGLAFLLLPAVAIGLDRLTVDLALAALCVAFALYVETEERIKLYTVLVVAGLARESGLLLIAACGLALARRRQWKAAALLAASAAPALAWYSYVHLHTPEYHAPPGVGPAWLPLSVPGFALLGRFLEPFRYTERAPLIAATALTLDYLSLAGAVAALVLAVKSAARREAGPLDLAALLYAALAMASGTIMGWADPFGYPRILSPLVLFLALLGLSARSPALLVPWILMLPRVWLQLGPRAVSLARWLSIS